MFCACRERKHNKLDGGRSEIKARGKRSLIVWAVLPLMVPASCFCYCYLLVLSWKQWWIDICRHTKEPIWTGMSAHLYQMLHRYILLPWSITSEWRAWNVCLLCCLVSLFCYILWVLRRQRKMLSTAMKTGRRRKKKVMLQNIKGWEGCIVKVQSRGLSIWSDSREK